MAQKPLPRKSAGSAAGMKFRAPPWPLLVLGILCIAFVARQFYGTVIATVAPDIMDDLRLTPDALGRVVGFHLVVVAMMQLPVGVLFDRYGPRPIMAALLLMGTAGSFLFASATSVVGLAISYAIIGAGFSGSLMGTLLVLAQTFPLRRLATYSSLVLASGGVGAMVSATPVAWVSEWLGWRAVFIGMGAATLLVSGSVLCFVGDGDRGNRVRPSGETLKSLALGFSAVWSTPGLLRLLAMSLLSYSTLSVMRGVWAGPYLHDVHGLSGVDLGNALLAMSVAMIAGTLTYGPLDRLLRSRKRIVVAGALCSAVIMLMLAYWQDTAIVIVLLVGLGLLGSYDVVLLTHARAVFPAEMAGRGMTTINVAAFSGAALLQVLTGYLIAELPDRFETAPADAYRITFGLIGVGIVAAAVVYSRIPDTPPES